MLDELKPCPFCAFERADVVDWETLRPFCAFERADVVDWETLHHTEYAVLCLNCGAQGPNDLGKSGAREAWNRRRKEYPPCEPD